MRTRFLYSLKNARNRKKYREKQSINRKRKSHRIHESPVVEININFYNAWREILFGDVYNRLSNPNEKVGDKGQEKGRKKRRI